MKKTWAYDEYERLFAGEHKRATIPEVIKGNSYTGEIIDDPFGA